MSKALRNDRRSSRQGALIVLEALEPRRLLAANPDFNQDGLWDSQDLDLLTVAIAADSDNLAYDLTVDQRVDLLDVEKWRIDAAKLNGFAEPYLHGDINLDGRVDALDFDAIQEHWQESDARWSAGNFDLNGKVDPADLNLMARNWTKTLTRSSPETTVAFHGGAIPIGGYPGFTVSADFDQDGIVDMAVGNLRADFVSVIYGSSDREVRKEEVQVGHLTSHLLAEDINDDGLPDLVALSGFGIVSVLLGTQGMGFTPVGTVEAPDESVFQTAGDFNNDSHVDVVVVHSRSNKISLLLGDGTGGFDAPIVTATGDEPVVAAAEDADQDGNLDLVLVLSGDRVVSTMFGNGDGTFGDRTDFPIGFSRWATISDFDGDGRLDVVSVATRETTVYQRNTEGTFDPHLIKDAGTEGGPIAVGDYDADGDQDLFIGSSHSGFIKIWEQSDDRTFFLEETLYLGDNSLIYFAPGDFDGDGKLDLVVPTAFGGLAIPFYGDGAGGFAAPHTYPLGFTYPSNLATGDFNADGIADLVVADSPMSLLTGLGNGQFEVKQTEAGLAAWVGSPVIGDFDGDGSPDIAAKTFNRIKVIYGGEEDSPRTWSFEFDGTGLSSTRPLATGDLNNDGKSDLVARDDHYIFVMLASETGFSAPILYGGAPSHAFVGDTDGDGVLDLIKLKNEVIEVLPGVGDGSFGPVIQTTIGDRESVSAAVGDFDRDGIVDIAIGFYANVSVRLGRGDGTFRAGKNFDSGANFNIVVADLNSDGRPDLLTANGFDHDISVLIGKGDGEFLYQQRFPVGYDARGIVAGDFDQDGIVDVAVTTQRRQSVSVLLGKDLSNQLKPSVFESSLSLRQDAQLARRAR